MDPIPRNETQQARVYECGRAAGHVAGRVRLQSVEVLSEVSKEWLRVGRRKHEVWDPILQGAAERYLEELTRNVQCLRLSRSVEDAVITTGRLGELRAHEVPNRRDLLSGPTRSLYQKRRHDELRPATAFYNHVVPEVLTGKEIAPRLGRSRDHPRIDVIVDLQDAVVREVAQVLTVRFHRLEVDGLDRARPLGHA